MRGIKSNGMLLCASNEAHTTVEPLTPPEGSKIGERVVYGDDETAAQPEPETPNKVCLFWFASFPCQISSCSHHHIVVTYTAWSLFAAQLINLTLLCCAVQVQKKKIWELVQPDLQTNSDRQVTYKGTVMNTGAGPVVASSLANAKIS